MNKNVAQALARRLRMMSYLTADVVPSASGKGYVVEVTDHANNGGLTITSPAEFERRFGKTRPQATTSEVAA